MIPTRYFKLAGLLSGAALFVAQPAAASVLTYDGFTWGSVATTVATTAPLDAPIGSGVDSTGGFNVHIDSGPSFVAWCMDVWQWLGGNDYTYQSSILGVKEDAGKVTLTQAKIDNLSRLATEAYSSINNATTSAAFQAAVWAISYDTPGSYNLASGAFTMTGASAVTLQAQTWLDGLGNYAAGGYSLSAWTSPTYQDALVFTKVPEPATYSLLFAGLVMMGFAARRQAVKL
ncbi:MAG: PEP-CTERM sorting domain-containing protein [Proteobacteria bacterium]|nr:PEP-CTERM sorting domain-containing protein [Pseudomonadota bacterium]